MRARICWAREASTAYHFLRVPAEPLGLAPGLNVLSRSATEVVQLPRMFASFSGQPSSSETSPAKCRLCSGPRAPAQRALVPRFPRSRTSPMCRIRVSRGPRQCSPVHLGDRMQFGHPLPEDAPVPATVIAAAATQGKGKGKATLTGAIVKGGRRGRGGRDGRRGGRGGDGRGRPR